MDKPTTEESKAETDIAYPTSKNGLPQELIEMKTHAPVEALEVEPHSAGLESKFKAFETFDKMTSFLEEKDSVGPLRRSEKMTQYFINELHVNKVNSRKKTWRKNYFIIILLVKNFINKMKKKIPNSKFSIEERHVRLINDKAHFYHDETKQNVKKIKKHSKFHKVVNRIFDLFYWLI